MANTARTVQTTSRNTVNRVSIGMVRLQCSQLYDAINESLPGLVESLPRMVGVAVMNEGTELAVLPCLQVGPLIL